MKILERIFDVVNSEFEKRKFLHFLRPVKDANEAFFLGTKERAEKAPFIRDHIDLKRYMWFVVLALTPATLAGVYFFGLRVLLVIAVSYVAGGIVELLFSMIRKHEINEGFLVTGLIFPLTLPPDIPLWMVAVGIMFGVAIGKEIFGGTGHNVFNPALVARCFLYLSYPAAMTSGWIKPGHNALKYITADTVDAVSAATPLALFKQGRLADVDITNLLTGWVPGSIGETSAVLLILGGLFLIVTGIVNFRTPLATIIGGGLMSAIFYYSGFKEFAPPLFTLLSGGFLYAAFFMGTDPVSSPNLNCSKWIYGFLLGVLIVLIRSLSGYPEGAMFSVLIVNLTAPLLDHIVLNTRYKPVKAV
jgi:Na(+)-translocating NADH:ubiquinone oxidoreductase B subunit